ncbi:MAG: hypothetical protein LBC77_01585 [Spirochaetaceae bacterium]|jgi:hypothetical protein|nr:hypothetical protein [Spirochaetaceae bacterium]
MADIRAKIELLLKDKFSPGIKGAGASVKNFGEQAVSAANTVNKAFSGLGAQVASLGVTLGAGALVKASIDFEDAIVRVGTNAGMSAAQTNQLRRSLIDVARDTKISRDEMSAFATMLGNYNIGFEEIMELAPYAGQAIQGLGMSGVELAEAFSTFKTRGGDVETFKRKLNELVEIDNLSVKGMNVSNFMKYLPQIAEYSDASVESLDEMYIAMITLGKGATDSKAFKQYISAMQDFANPETRNAIRKTTGFDTKDKNGNLKSFAEIMGVLVEKGKQVGNFDALEKGLHISAATLQAIKQYNNHAKEVRDEIGELGDTSDAVSKRADANMQTMKSALTGLQGAIMAQSDSALVKPLETITRLLNENPKGLETAIKGVAAALIALTTIKAFASVVSFMANMKSLVGGKVGAGLAGSAGIPVHVTNPGAMGAGSLLDGTPISGKGGSGAKALTSARAAVGGLSVQQYAMGGATAGIGAAFIKIPQMMGELDAIEQNEDLSEKEKSKEKGGAIGDAAGGILGGVAGGIGGVAAGAAVGAAVGSVVPVLGTAVGALVGAGVGALGMWLGSKAGRAIGEGIGEAVAEDENEGYVPAMQGVPLNSMAYLAESGGVANQSIEPVVVGTEVTFKDDRTEVRTYNKTERGSFGNYQYATGYNPYARAMP